MHPYENHLLKRTFDIWFSINEKLRFLLVGGYNTLFAYLIFCLLNYLLASHLHYLVILAITHIICVLNSFFNFRFFVFRSQKNLLREYLKVNIVYLGYFICNAAMLYVLKDLLNINILLSQLICVTTITTAIYFTHKNFSFKK